MPTNQDLRGLLRQPLTFEKGVFEALEQSVLPPGFAAVLENWRPEANGGLRIRSGWVNASTTSAPAAASRRTTGIGYSSYLDTDTSPPVGTYYTAVRTTVDTQVKILSIPKASLAGGTWTTVETIALGSGAGQPMKFAFGLGKLIYTSAGLGGLRKWDGTTAAAIATTPQNQRALVYAFSRFFAGGGKDPAGTSFPHRLWYSALSDDPSLTVSWPTANYIDVGRPDGEPIEDIAEFDGTLVVGKENSVWIVSGDNPDAFDPHELPGDAGVAPGNTVIPTPFGVVLVGKEQVWLYDGSMPRYISEAVEQSYGMTGTFMSAAYVDGKCWITDQGQNLVWVYDMRTGVWWKETLDNANESPAVLGSQGQNLLMGPVNGTISSILQSRSFPLGATRVKDADTHAETFKVTTPEYWLGGPERPATFRHLDLRIRQRGGNGAQTGLSIVPSVRDGDGVLTAGATITVTPIAAAGVFRVRKDLPGMTGYGISFAITQTVPSGQASVMDIEEAVLLFAQEGQR